jgi:4-hydroxybenzoate polyprenyltransferase
LETGTFSLPAKLGIGPALWISRLTHATSAGLILMLGWYCPELGILYLAGAGIAIALLIIEHSLVQPADLSKVGLAFFTINGIISLLLGTLGIVDVLRH